MSRISDCTVHLESGEEIEDTGVLLKDSGWVRVGSDGGYTYYPNERVERIERETGQ